MSQSPYSKAARAWIAWQGGEQEEQAGCLISAVGSLSVAQLRLAGASEATVIHGDLEILSLCGTLSPDGAHHRRAGDRPAAGMAVPPGTGSSYGVRRAGDQGSARPVIAP